MENSNYVEVVEKKFETLGERTDVSEMRDFQKKTKDYSFINRVFNL